MATLTLPFVYEDVEVFAGSFWHRYCEPDGTYVCLDRSKLKAHLDEAMTEERDFMVNGCDLGIDDEDDVDLCWNGVGRESAASMMTAEEFAEFAEELRRGEVVFLAR